jgi:hypothetical protein
MKTLQTAAGIAALLLGSGAARADLIRVETNAAKTAAGQNWVCEINPLSAPDGALAGADYKCTETELMNVSVAQLQQPEGTVVLRVANRDALRARLEPGFNLYQDGFVRLTYIKSGLTGTYAEARLHLYRIGAQWLARVVDLPTGEQDFERLCAVKNTVLGQVVGIREIRLPGPAGCEF